MAYLKRCFKSRVDIQHTAPATAHTLHTLLRTLVATFNCCEPIPLTPRKRPSSTPPNHSTTPAGQSHPSHSLKQLKRHKHHHPVESCVLCVFGPSTCFSSRCMELLPYRRVTERLFKAWPPPITRPNRESIPLRVTVMYQSSSDDRVCWVHRSR